MRKLLLTSLCLLVAAGTVLAHWDPGDTYKMHYPQLPDPNGFDVSLAFDLADDWLCTLSGAHLRHPYSRRSSLKC